MADKYKGWVVENAHKPAFRTVYQGRLGCSDMHAVSKATLLEIALNFDRRHHPLSLSDPDIEHKINAVQLAEVQQQVEIAKLKKKGIKTDAGGTGQNDKEAAAGSEQVQKTETTTARPGKGKARGQDGEATSDNSAAADLGQDGDVRMAGDEDAAEAAPPVDLTAEAVPSPVDDNRKRKRTDTVSSFDTQRAGTVRPKTSLIVKLKLRGSARVGTRGMQTTTQGLGVHQGQNQVAEDTRPVKARRLVDKQGSRLQHDLARPPALAKSTGSGKKDSDDAVAEGMSDVFGTAAPVNTLEQLPLRRQPQRKNRVKTYMPVEGEAAAVDGTLDNNKDLAEGGVASDALSAVSDGKRNPDKDTETKVAEKGFPRDMDGNYKSFPWSGKMVDYLKEETEEEEAFYPYNLLSGPGRMRRLEAQERRKIKQAEEKGEVYVPEPVKEPYDWTKHI